MFNRSLKNAALPSVLLCHHERVGFYSHACPQMAVTNQGIMSTFQRMTYKAKGHLLRRRLLIWNGIPLPSTFSLISVQPALGHLPILGPVIGKQEFSQLVLSPGAGRGFPCQRSRDLSPLSQHKSGTVAMSNRHCHPQRANVCQGIRNNII